MVKDNRSGPKGPTQRQLKVGELIRHALSEIFLEETLYDAAVKDVSITVSEVRVSADLRNATVFVLPLGGTASDECLEGLKRLTPRLRTLLAKRVNLRFSPELYFRLDHSFDQVNRIENLLRNITESVIDKVDE